MPRGRIIDADVPDFPVTVPEDSMPSEQILLPPTIQEVMAFIMTYLLAQHQASPAAQEAVYDLGRMYTDGHLLRAWRGFSQMVAVILTAPLGD